MNKHNSVPSIRFNGFKDEWKLSKLGNDLISIHTGTNLLGSEKPGGIPLIKMGNLKNGFFDFSKLDYLPICENVKNEDKVRFGDFLFNTRNTLDLVGKGATWMYESTKFAYNNNIAKFNFQNSINTVFFNYLYNTYNVMNQVHARATGTTSVAAIYPKSLDSIIYNLPSKHEQQKIGNFFAKLDKLLDLQQQKIDKLELLKKALLQKLFPKSDSKTPELRFKGYEEDWSVKKLGEITKYVKGYAFQSQSYTKHGVRIIRATDISNHNIQKEKNSSIFLSKDMAKSYLKYIIHKKDIIITTVGVNMGNAIYVYEEQYSLLNQNLVKISTIDGFDSLFVYFQLKQPHYLNYISRIERGNAQTSIAINDLWNYSFKVPKIGEQQKIGNLLSKVDHLIYLENKKLQNFQQIKKCLLQNMFVE